MPTFPPVVEFEIARYQPAVHIFGVIAVPGIRKLRLTEKSELAIFGDLNPYRDFNTPPL